MEQKQIKAIPTEPHQNGLAIRRFRVAAGLTVQELADMIDCTPAHLRNIENEHRDASDVYLARIAKSINQPTGALIRHQREEVAS